MTKQRAFIELWHKRGRYGALAQEHMVCLPAGEQIFLDMFLANLITEFDIRMCRMLYDFVYDQETIDDDFVLFLLMMSVSLNQGNVYLPAGQDDMLTEYKKYHEQAIVINASNGRKVAESVAIDFKDRIQGFGEKYDKGMYEACIGPLHKPIVKDHEGWFFQKYHHAHVLVKTILLCRLKKSLQQSANDKIVSAALAKVLQHSRLHSNQKIACALACIAKTIVITGCPGTGKTSVVSAALKAIMLAEQDLVASQDIIICAPTGRAAARLEQSIVADSMQDTGTFPETISLREIKGKTVHGVLGYDPTTGGFGHGKDNPLDARIIVVDEVSMLDISIFSILLDAIQEETTLILLGDQNQLPSVDAGAVLGDITQAYGYAESLEGNIPTLSEPVFDRLAAILSLNLEKDLICKDLRKTAMTDKLIVLTKSFRSQKDIIDIAGLIKNQIPLEEMSFSGYCYVATNTVFGDNADRIWNVLNNTQHGVLRTASPHPREHIAEWINRYFGQEYKKAIMESISLWENANQDGKMPLFVDDAQPELYQALANLFLHLDASAILCIVRNGEWGSMGANGIAEKIVRKELGGNLGEPFFSGCIALVTINMRHRNLWNGDRGIVMNLGNRIFFVARRHNGFEAIPLDEIRGIEQSFALTVHKSQGCEFENILCVLVGDMRHPLLTKEILYTALTRAKQSAVICGSAEVFDAAIGRKVVRRSRVI